MVSTNNKPQCLIRNPTFEEFIFCNEITYKQADAVSVAEILTRNTNYDVSIVIEKPFMKKGRHLWRVAVNGEMVPIGMYLLVFEDGVQFVDEEHLVARYLDTGLYETGSSDIGTSDIGTSDTGAGELESSSTKKSSEQEGIANEIETKIETEIETKIDDEESVYKSSREGTGDVASDCRTAGAVHEEEDAGACSTCLPGGVLQPQGLGGGANLIGMLAGMLAGAGMPTDVDSGADPNNHPRQDPGS